MLVNIKESTIFVFPLSGQCGITMNSDWSEPKDPNNPADVAASEKTMQCKLGWYSGPIFGKDGDYPKMFKDQVANIQKALGLKKSPLPEFTDEEKKLNKGKSVLCMASFRI